MTASYQLAVDHLQTTSSAVDHPKARAQAGCGPEYWKRRRHHHCVELNPANEICQPRHSL